jgi:hypothetical protein
VTYDPVASDPTEPGVVVAPDAYPRADAVAVMGRAADVLARIEGWAHDIAAGVNADLNTGRIIGAAGSMRRLIEAAHD